MKKIFKSFLIFVMIVPLMVVFVACKKENKDNSTSETTPITPSAPVVADTYTVSFDYNLPHKYLSVKENDSVYNQVGTAFTLPTFEGTMFDGLLDYWKNENGEKIDTNSVSGGKNEDIKVEAVWKKDLTLYLSSTGILFDYDTSLKTAKVTGTSNAISDVLVIPTYVEHDGQQYLVTKITENAFRNNASITSVLTYLNSIQVESNAFYGSKVKTFEFEIVTNIGDYAFAETNIENVVFDSSLLTIGNSVFSGCNNLKSVDFSKVSAESLNKLPNEIFFGCSQLTTFVPSATFVSIGNEAFKNCSSFSSVEFLKTYNISTIGDKAFQNTAITSLTIPSQISKIGSLVFDGCNIVNLELGVLYYNPEFSGLFLDIFGDIRQSLKSLKLKNTVDTIYPYYFQDFKSLESLDLSECSGISSIGAYSFNGCSNLQIVSFSESMNPDAFIVSAFYNTKWYSEFDGFLIINKNLLFAPSSYAGEEGKINIPSNVEIIATKAFSNNSKITEVVIPSSVKTIGVQAFENCSSLKKVSFEDSSNIMSIGDYAFYNCVKLEFFDLSVCLELASIGSYSFASVGSISNFIIPNSVESIGNSAFSSAKIGVFTIDSNSKYSTINGALYEVSQTGDVVSLVAYPVGIESKTLRLPSTLTKIYNNAFSANYNLEYIFIEGTNIDIGDNAFYNVLSSGPKILSAYEIERLAYEYLTTYYLVSDSYYSFDGTNFEFLDIPYDEIYSYYAVVGEDVYLIDLNVSGETITVVTAEKISI